MKRLYFMFLVLLCVPATNAAGFGNMFDSLIKKPPTGPAPQPPVQPKPQPPVQPKPQSPQPNQPNKNGIQR